VQLSYVVGDVDVLASSESGADRTTEAAASTWWLDGQPLELTVQGRGSTGAQGASPSWRASGVIELPVASGTTAVTLDVMAFDVDDVLEQWATVNVETLMDRRTAWLAEQRPGA
jgi:hypothetical protein